MLQQLLRTREPSFIKGRSSNPKYLMNECVGMGLPLEKASMDLDSFSIRPLPEGILGLLEGWSDQRTPRSHIIYYLVP